MALLRRALVAAVLVTMAGCYSPAQRSCAFACVDDGVCPAGFTCQADGVCHRDGDQGTCNIPSQVDAADAGANDAAD